MERVLIIDDEENFAHMVRAMLRRGGYQADAVTSSVKGLQILEEEQYDVVLCDVRMPQDPLNLR